MASFLFPSHRSCGARARKKATLARRDPRRFRHELIPPLVVLLSLPPSITNAVPIGTSYNHCPSDSIRDSKSVASLAPNTFHKICPGKRPSYVTLGQPICGDGTPFSFYFAGPTKAKSNQDKLLIEFMGGGACWDSNTCGINEGYLTFPEKLDAFLGLSCSEVNVALDGNDDNDGKPISMLCAKEVGGVDFTEYNTVVVPYCTQDIHIGDNVITYDGTTINHRGGHNLVTTMNWIFKNFPNPSHVALTGCSAGGTALPIAYDIINKHYNSILHGSMPGMRSVHTNVILDSPVYLTPSYFLNNALDNWNPGTIMRRIRFNWRRYRTDEDYPNRIMNHVLRRGSNRDKWGIVTHTYDPISEFYWSYMRGDYADDDDDDDAGDDDEGENNNNNGDNNQWWSQLQASITSVQAKHKNVDLYTIDSEGHCSFGLYYPLQEDGFEEWAGNIYQETNVYGRTMPSVPLFISGAILGMGLAAGSMYAAKQRQKPATEGLSDVILLDSEMKTEPKWKSKIRHFLLRFQSYPITTGYGLAVSFYFITMLICGGFVHPIDNPSFGPSAYVLSNFGINNPSLVVYKHQVWRLTTSAFLCSGFLTYFMVVGCLWKYSRVVEQRIGNTVTYALVSCLILVGSGLLYACVAQGASCASVGLVLGLNSFSVARARKEEQGTESGKGIEITEEGEGAVKFPKPWLATIVLFVLTAVLFPFNSWVILLTSMVLGVLVALLLVSDIRDEEDSTSLQVQERQRISNKLTPKMLPIKVLLGAYFVMFLLILIQVPRPNPMYKYPYMTGCTMVYTSDGIGDIVNGYVNNANDNEGDNRHLNEDEEGGSNDDNNNPDMCAQICIPNLAHRPALLGVSSVTGMEVQQGVCEDHGYGVHVADKTFKYVGVSIDVELYYEDGYGE